MKLSIITVCLNNLIGLKRTADSILCQTNQSFEWLVIDGGSTDGTKEFLTSLTHQPNYWCSEPDNGIYNAMNKAISIATGDYLLFLNSGDSLVDINVLEQVYPLLKGGDIIYGDAFFCESGKQRLVHYPEKFTLYDFWNTYTPCHQATFIKASLLKENGYDEHYKIVADYKKWIQWKLAGYTFHHINVTICYYMLDGISTLNQELHSKEHSSVVKELFSSLWQEQMEQIDWLKNFYEDAVASREKAIADKNDQIQEYKDKYNTLERHSEPIRNQFNHKAVIHFSLLLIKIKSFFHRKKVEQMLSQYKDYDAKHPF